MGGLIISCLGSLREMIKRKERRRKRSRKRRRRRRSFSRWFLFSPPSSFLLLCLKNITGRFGHKKNLRKSCNRLQNFVYLHQYEIEKHFPEIRLPCRSGEQGGRSEPIWLILRTNVADIIVWNDWYWFVQWLKQRGNKTEIECNRAPWLTFCRNSWWYS